MTLQDQLQSTLADRYLIERELGRGGMATVYLARDIKHSRHVALKLLNPDLGAVLGAERFLSEIRVTANLQHPNLLPLFDSGEANGLLYYVMPYVEGESLRVRLDREKQLPVDEAVRIAVAIANALEYAHGHGVIHRDLKPENILLQHDQPVVADFGIALAVSNAGGTRVTQTGLSLGTPQYMSPEQATGDRLIDKRADIYSLGAMTYEMLAGEPPHVGATAQAIIARLMTEEPRSLTTARRNVPAHVDAAVHHALEKLPADRFATAREFADALQGRGAIATTRHSSSPATASAAARYTRVATIAAVAAFALAIVAGAAWWKATHQAPPPPLRFAVEQPGGIHLETASSGYPIAITRDGQAVAYLAGMPRRVFIRRLDRLAPEDFAKAMTPSDVHFSEDGKSLAFLSNSTLRQTRVTATDGGTDPTLVVTLSAWSGLSWEHGRDIVWVTRDTLFAISPNGGKPRMIAAVDPAEDGHWTGPVLLPHDVVALRVTPRGGAYGTAADRLGLLPLKGGKRVLVDIPYQSAVGYVDGVFVYGEVSGRVSAVRLNLQSGKLDGEPMPVVENVFFKPNGGVAAVMADEGTLAYIMGSTQALQQIVDERGAVLVTLAEQRNFVSPSLSPDGTRIAMGIGANGGYEVWVYDLRSKLLTRLAPDGYRTAWTVDGKRIAFIESGTAGRVLWMPADGSTAPVQLPGSEGLAARQVAFSPDGKYAVVYTAPSPTRAQAARAYAIPLAGGAVTPLLTDVLNPAEPQVSPNGKWISYTSGESGSSEVVVRPFPSGTGRVQISSSGGWEGKWSGDGTKLFFRSASAVRTAVLDISGAMPRVTRIDSLFPDMWVNNTAAFSWDVSKDGKRFVMRRESGDARIVVEKNWLPEVIAKMGRR